jgi:hypothetical protein
MNQPEPGAREVAADQPQPQCGGDNSISSETSIS